MTTRALLCLSLLLLAAGCKKTLDPAYKGALDARHNAICDCATKDKAVAATCYETAVKEHPEPKTPGGEPFPLYRESLEDADKAILKKSIALTEACEMEVQTHARENQESLEKAAREKQAAEAKRAADQAAAQKAAAKPHGKKAGKHRGKKHHR
jgi:hypothetical protein